jgi:hypothetical protein
MTEPKNAARINKYGSAAENKGFIGGLFPMRDNKNHM